MTKKKTTKLKLKSKSSTQTRSNGRSSTSSPKSLLAKRSSSLASTSDEPSPSPQTGSSEPISALARKRLSASSSGGTSSTALSRKRTGSTGSTSKADGVSLRPLRIHDQPFGERWEPPTESSAAAKKRTTKLSSRTSTKQNSTRSAGLTAKELAEKTYRRLEEIGAHKRTKTTGKGLHVGDRVRITWTYDPAFGVGDGSFTGRIEEIDDWIKARNETATFHAPLTFVAVKKLK